jgi:uncharacterized protein YjbJ (UPF0337 family)
MNMNQQVNKGKWLQMKGELQKSWGKLTNDELDKTQGDMKAVGGLIQQRYGHAQEKYSKQLAEIFSQFEEKKEDAVKNFKKNMKK